MAIVIEQILGQTDSGVQAIMRHADQKLAVEVAGSIDQITEALGKSMAAELGFAAVVEWLILGEDASPRMGYFKTARTGTSVS
jgi:hypothetical protein